MKFQEQHDLLINAGATLGFKHEPCLAQDFKYYLYRTPTNKSIVILRTPLATRQFLECDPIAEFSNE